MMVRKSLFTLFLLIFSTMVPLTAQANEEKAKAGALFKEGNALRAEKKYPEALAKYQEAYRLFKSFKIELNAALTLHEMGRLAEAAEAYERFLWSGKNKIEVSVWQLTRDKLTALQVNLGMLRVRALNQEAVVVVDGLVRGKVSKPWPTYLLPGEHTLKVRIPDEDSFETKIDLVAGVKKHVWAGPTEKSLPKPVEPAATESEKSTAAEKKKRQAELAASARVSRGRWTRTMAAWALLGVGAACAITSGVLYGVGISSGNEAHDAYLSTSDKDEIATHRQEVESAEKIIAGGHVMAGLTAAATVASVVLFVTRPEAQAAEVTMFGVSPLVQGAAISLSGRF